MSAVELERRVVELEESSKGLRQDCDDYRRMAFEADLRLRSFTSTLAETLRAESAEMRETVRQVTDAVAEDKANRSAQLQQIEAQLKESMRADMSTVAAEVAQQSTPLFAEHAERIEAAEVALDLESSMRQMLARDHAEERERTLGALQHASGECQELRGLMENHEDQQEKLLVLVERQSAALAELRQQQKAQGESQQGFTDWCTEQQELQAAQRGALDEHILVSATAHAQLRSEAQAEVARALAATKEVQTEARMMQVSVVQQVEGRLEQKLRPVTEAAAKLQTEVEHTLETRCVQREYGESTFATPLR